MACEFILNILVPNVIIHKIQFTLAGLLRNCQSISIGKNLNEVDLNGRSCQ